MSSWDVRTDFHVSSETGGMRESNRRLSVNLVNLVNPVEKIKSLDMINKIYMMT